jgi:TetR/AcrR family transcriptional regulator, transcriptional repressor for nem operon
MSGVFLAAFPSGDEDATRKAQLIVTLCVGGMVIARTVDEPLLQTTLRAAARNEALSLLAGPTSTARNVVRNGPLRRP